MSGTMPSPRRIAGALAVLQALPPVALADLAERLIARLDALDGDVDAEPDDDDCCPGGDDDPASSRAGRSDAGMGWGPGDPADGEPNDDGEAGPDDEGPWWPLSRGPDGCGPVLAGVA